MDDIRPETVLHRVPDLTVRMHADDQIVVSLGRHRVECGRHGLAVLDAFACPRTFADAAAELQSRAAGAQDWVDLTRTIHTLHQAGFLDGGTGALPAEPHGFDTARRHIEMLDDRSRTAAFIEAIDKTVRPGDVVVDLGTGTGVLAAAAARAGARHVYAIEAGAIGRSAHALFERNGLADRVTLVAGWSHQVSLPERADVLVTETVGDDAFGERILESVRDARRRLVRAGARFVPERIRTLLLPVSTPRGFLARHQFSAAAAQRWRAWYGIDFDTLSAERPQVATVRPSRARRWRRLAEPLLAADVELATVEDVVIDSRSECVATSGGLLNGVLVFFELQLAPGVVLSIHPDRAGAECSWRCPVWLLPSPIRIGAGDRLAVSYRYRTGPDDGVSVDRA